MIARKAFTIYTNRNRRRNRKSYAEIFSISGDLLPEENLMMEGAWTIRPIVYTCDTKRERRWPFVIGTRNRRTKRSAGLSRNDDSIIPLLTGWRAFRLRGYDTVYCYNNYSRTRWTSDCDTEILRNDGNFIRQTSEKPGARPTIPATFEFIPTRTPLQTFRYFSVRYNKQRRLLINLSVCPSNGNSLTMTPRSFRTGTAQFDRIFVCCPRSRRPQYNSPFPYAPTGEYDLRRSTCASRVPTGTRCLFPWSARKNART